MKKKDLNDRSLSALTIELDPEKKGVVAMTIRRARMGQNVNLKSLCLICYALEIEPEYAFIKAEELKTTK